MITTEGQHVQLGGYLLVGIPTGRKIFGLPDAPATTFVSDSAAAKQAIASIPSNGSVDGPIDSNIRAVIAWSKQFKGLTLVNVSQKKEGIVGPILAFKRTRTQIEVPPLLLEPESYQFNTPPTRTYHW